MITNIENKYKDNLPENTINNIIEFFKSKNCSVFIVNIKEPVPNIWWCSLELKYNNTVIQRANGKGSSKIFALASGFSELYERYCCLMPDLYRTKINKRKMYDISKKLNGYNLYPDEKFIELEDILTNCPRIKKFINSINDDEDSAIKYYKQKDQNGVLCIPFINLKEKENKNELQKNLYLPLELLETTVGSSGMAAGNSIEEALTQSLSEICEHFVSEAIFFENRNNFYYIKDIQKIKCSSHIKDYFIQLSEKGYKYYIYDFSYLYNVPVVGLLVIDPNTHVSYLNLGSSPIFSIALERCCTEVYQGHSILGDNLKPIMRPFRNYNNKTELIDRSLTTIVFETSYPDNLLLKNIGVDNYNINIFLEDNKYTNQELNNYYINIFEKLSWDVYYRDFSQSDKMFAVWSYVNNISIRDTKTRINNNIPIEEKKKRWDITFKQNLLFEQYLNNQDFDLVDLFALSILRQKQLIPILGIDTFSEQLDFFTMINFKFNQNNKGFTFDLLFNSLFDIDLYGNFLLIEKDNINYPEINFYSLLYLYSKKYNLQELKTLSNIYGFNYSEEDYNNRYNLKYLLNKIYFELGYNYYYSNEYEKIIQNFIPILSRAK